MRQIGRLQEGGRAVCSVRLQFGGDFDVLPVERGQPVAAVERGTAELLFLAERHVVVGGTDDGRGNHRGRRGSRPVVRRRVVRCVCAAERAGAVGPAAAAHTRRPGRSRRF